LGKREDVCEPFRVVPHPPIIFNVPNGIDEVGWDGAPKPLNCDGARRLLDAGQKFRISEDINGRLVAKEDPGRPSLWVSARPRGAAGNCSPLTVARGGGDARCGAG
jgi:hypothetical protein